MTLSATTIAKLNKMNRAAQDAVLGTLLSTFETNATVSGSLTVSDAQNNASLVDIATGLTAIEGFTVQTYQTGSLIWAQNAVSSGSNITVYTGSAPEASGVEGVNLDDSMFWMAWE